MRLDHPRSNDNLLASDKGAIYLLIVWCCDVLFGFEICSKIRRWVHNGRVPNLECTIHYTILCFYRQQGLKLLLKLTETISSTHELRLNKDQCVAIQINNYGLAHFGARSNLCGKRHQQGSKHLTWHFEQNAREVYIRQTWSKLLPYWEATKATKYS